MKNEKKMSYLGMECIFSHMDFNTRQSLTKRCPSVQSLDERIPLRINTLMVGSNFIQINDTDYGMGIIQQYDDHNTPKHIININDQGGFQREVDRYGFQDSVRPRIMESTRKHHEKAKLEYETEKKQVEKMEPGMFRRMSLLRLERKIREVDSELLRFLLKEQHLDPPFQHYLQLRITSKNNTRVKLEKMEKWKTLSEATSDLLDYLIPKRRIFINNFIVYDLQNTPSVQRILENDDAFYSIRNVSLETLLPDNLFNYKHPLVSVRNYSAFDESLNIYIICRDWPENLLKEVHLVLESMDRTSAFQIFDDLKQGIRGLIDETILNLEDPYDFQGFVRIPKNAEFELKLYLKPTTKREKFDFHFEFNKVF